MQRGNPINLNASKMRFLVVSEMLTFNALNNSRSGFALSIPPDRLMLFAPSWGKFWRHFNAY